MNASSEIQCIIDRVEVGVFDAVLRSLEKSDLGIFIPAQAVDNLVVPIPPGHSQTESNLEIAITDEPVTGTTRVGWFGRGGLGSDCAGHCNFHCHNHRPKHYSNDRMLECDFHCHHRGQFHDVVDPLADASELHPALVEAQVAAMCTAGSLCLDELAAGGVGIALLHGHSPRYEFTVLPDGVVSTIENGKTHFRQRTDVVDANGFVANAWRLENGVRQPVGGFV